MSARTEHDGFTLLELLVATAITLLLAGLLLAAAVGGLDIWRRTQGRLSANAQALAVLDLLERDLQAAVRRDTGDTWLAVDVIESPAALVPHGWLTGASMMKPSGDASRRLRPAEADPFAEGIARTRFGLSGAWLRFVTTNVETGGSLPVVVSYQIARRPVTGPIQAGNPAEVRYTLFRSAVSAEQTLANGYSVDGAAYRSVSPAPAGTRSAATVGNPNNADALAANVIDFGVWLHVREPDGRLRLFFPETRDDTVHAATGDAGASDAARYPDVVDIMVRILGDDGAALLESIENGAVTRPPEFGDDAAWWWRTVEAHSRVFVRRIVLRSDRS